MPDVRMPDGTIIRGVPEGTTRAELERRYQVQKASGRYDKLTHGEASSAYQHGRNELARLTRDMTPAQRSQRIQAYEASPTATALRRRMNNTSGMFGAMAGALKPLDNAALWASKIPGIGPAIDNLGQAMGMQSTRQAYDRNQRARSGNENKGAQIVGNIAGTLPTLAIGGGVAAPFLQGAATGALLTENADNPRDVLWNAA